MEWIIGLFVLWLIGSLSGGSSKPSRDAKRKSEKEALENLESVLKRLNIEVDGESNKKIIKTDLPDVSIPLPDARRTYDEKPLPLQKVPPRVEDDSCSDIINAFKQYGITSVWHMTHTNNISEILSSGILSNKSAYKNKKPIDISDHSVQRWRELSDPIYDRNLHEYAPTYINIRNPMLYVRRNIQQDLCLIEISLSALSENNFIFTDGNAAARNTHFYSDKNDLGKLPWDVLNSSFWNSFPDGKRKRCSEVLIYPKIEQKHIIKLHCCSMTAFIKLSQFGIPVELSESLYFLK